MSGATADVLCVVAIMAGVGIIAYALGRANARAEHTRLQYTAAEARSIARELFTHLRVLGSPIPANLRRRAVRYVEGAE